MNVKVLWEGDKVANAINRAGFAGLSEAAEAVRTAAMQIVPLKEGTLMRSGVVTTGSLPDADEIFQGAKAGRDMAQAFAPSPEEAARAEEVYISYNTPYAVRLHEHPEYHFKQGRRGKWLEEAISKVAPGIEAIIAGHIKDTFGG